MISLNSVLEFIQLSGLTTDRFESLARLEPGTIENARKTSKELANNVIVNIVSFLGPALLNYEFDIVPSRRKPGSYMLIPPDIEKYFVR